MKLSLVTLNTLGTPFLAPDITKRYKRIAYLINNADYDIVCLQEIFTYYHFSLFKNALKNYPYVIFQKNPLGPRGGLVIFSKIKLANPTFVTFSFPQGATVPFYVRIAQQGILTAEIEVPGLTIVTTHLSSDNTHNLKPKNKLYTLIKNEVGEVTNLVNRYQKTGKPLIVAGDFNIAKYSELYKNLIENTDLVDIFKHDETPTYSPGRIRYFYEAEEDRCDYMFIKSNDRKIKVIKTDMVLSQIETLVTGKKSYLSDHIGLHCILEIND